MSKSIYLKQVLIIALVAFILGVNVCYAVDLNLTDDSLIDLTLDENISTNTSSDSNSTSGNTSTNTTTSDSTNLETNTSFDDSSSVTVSTMSQQGSTELTLSNIINIFLIVIGVLLILLAIAILIRLKG